LVLPTSAQLYTKLKLIQRDRSQSISQEVNGNYLLTEQTICPSLTQWVKNMEIISAEMPIMMHNPTFVPEDIIVC
jgi:hypothetical protein